MRNKKLILVLSGAVLFGLIAAFSVSRMLSNAQSYANDLNRVVVAKVDIAPGSKIIEEQLTTVQFPKEATPAGSFKSPKELVGRVTIMSIAAKEPVMDLKLAPEGAAGGLSAMISEGFRAMTVKVDDVVGVSGFIAPGSLVDVVVVITPSDKSLTKDPISKIVLQNIKVLANGQNIDQPKTGREAESVNAVTLQVTPDQAEKLALAATEGRLQLVLRNSVDQTDAQTTGANKQSLLTGERAFIAPEPMTPTSDAQKIMPSPPSPVSRRASVPRPAPAQPARQESRTSAALQPPAPRSNSVEMIEGAKKRSVDFP